MGDRPIFDKRKQSPVLESLQSPKGMTPIVSPTERTRFDASRTGSTAKSSSFGDTPSTVASPQDPRMTPTRRMLFQRKRLSSNAYGASTPSTYFTPRQNDENSGGSRGVIARWTNNSPANEQENQNKKIQDRFVSIQKGLGSINEERNELLVKSKQLEQEKKQIAKQLKLREREILALIKRCAAQEEKMRETSKLRIENRDLKDRLNQVSHRLSAIEQDEADLYGLKKKLQDSELQREHLKDKLALLQREHNSIMDTLQECFGKIRILTEEQERLEEERRRDRRTAEAQLAKARTEHEQTASSLQEDIKLQQTRIIQMEKILKDNLFSNTSLRRENALLLSEKKKEKESLEETTRRYENQMAELQAEIERTTKGQAVSFENDLEMLHNQMDEKKAAYDAKLSQMKEKIDEKDHAIKRLQSELSMQMAEAIAKQGTIDKIDEENKCLKEKVEAVSKLEIERDALIDYVNVVDSNMASLMDENASLIIAKDVLELEISDHKTTIAQLNARLECLQDEQAVAAAHSITHKVNIELSSESTDLKLQLENSRTQVAELQHERDEQNKIVRCLNNDLVEARLASERTQTMVELAELSTNSTPSVSFSETKYLTQTDRADIGALNQLDEASSRVFALEEQLKKKNTKTEFLQSKFDATKMAVVEFENQIHEMENDRVLDLSLQHEQKARSAENYIHTATVESKLLRLEGSLQLLNDELNSKSNIIIDLKAYANKIVEENALLSSNLRNTTSCLDETKFELQGSKDELMLARSEIQDSKADLAQSKAALHSVEKALMDYTEMVTSLQQEVHAANRELEKLRNPLLDQTEQAQHEEQENFSTEVTDIIIDLGKKLDRKESEINNIITTNNKLQEELHLLKAALADERSARDRTEVESVKQQENMATIRCELDESKRASEKLLQQVEKLQADLHNSRSSNLTSISALETQVQSLTTNIALKDDEIRELRLIELQDAEETIESLKGELQALQEQLVCQKTETTMEIREWQQKAQEFENLEREARAEIEKLKGEMQHVVVRERELNDIRVNDMMTEMECLRLRLAKEEAFGGGLITARNDINPVKDQSKELSKMRRKNKLLERENLDLQDKVKRQEIFLHKKIEKEKALREKNFQTPTKRERVHKTPSNRATSESLRCGIGPHKSASVFSRPRSRLQGPSAFPRRSMSASLSPGMASSPSSVGSRTSRDHGPSSNLPCYRTPRSDLPKSCMLSSKASPSISYISFDENASMSSADEFSCIFMNTSPTKTKAQIQEKQTGEI
jgi:hypothetical protein